MSPIIRRGARQAYEPPIPIPIAGGSDSAHGVDAGESVLVQSGGGTQPSPLADITVVPAAHLALGWGNYGLTGISDATQATWKSRGWGGFTRSYNYLYGYGGTSDFSPVSQVGNAIARYGDQRAYENAQTFQSSNNRGMYSGFGVHFQQYTNGTGTQQSPFPDWWNDANWVTIAQRLGDMAGFLDLVGGKVLTLDNEPYDGKVWAPATQSPNFVWGGLAKNTPYTSTVRPGGSALSEGLVIEQTDDGMIARYTNGAWVTMTPTVFLQQVEDRGYQVGTAIFTENPDLHLMVYSVHPPGAWFYNQYNNVGSGNQITTDADVDTMWRFYVGVWKAMRDLNCVNAKFRYAMADFYKPTSQNASASLETALRANKWGMYASIAQTLIASGNQSVWDFMASLITVHYWSWASTDGSSFYVSVVGDNGETGEGTFASQNALYRENSMDTIRLIYLYNTNDTGDTSGTPNTYMHAGNDWFIYSGSNPPGGHLAGMQASAVPGNVADTSAPTFTNFAASRSGNTVSFSVRAAHPHAIAYVEWELFQSGSATAVTARGKTNMVVTRGTLASSLSGTYDTCAADIPNAISGLYGRITVYSTMGHRTSRIVQFTATGATVTSGAPVVPSAMTAAVTVGPIMDKITQFTSQAFLQTRSQAAITSDANVRGNRGYFAGMGRLYGYGGSDPVTADPTATYDATDGRASWTIAQRFKANQLAVRAQNSGQEWWFGMAAAPYGATWDGIWVWPPFDNDDEWAKFLNDYYLLTRNNLTGGTFTLTFKGQTTAPIQWNATAAQIQAALEALSNVNVGDIRCYTPPTAPTFVYVIMNTGGQYAGTYIPSAQFTGNLASLTGTGTVTKTFTHQDGEGMFHWCAFAYNNNCDGLFIDCEDYSGSTGQQAQQGYFWDNPANTKDEQTTRAFARQRGREMMTMWTKVWTSRPVKFGFYFWEDPPAGWLPDVIRPANNQVSGAAKNLWTEVLDGMTQIKGYGQLCFFDNSLQKTTQQAAGDWMGATQYNSCKVTAALSKRFARWDLACDKFNTSPMLAVGPFSAPECGFSYARSPASVKNQIDAARKYAMDYMTNFDYGAAWVTNNPSTDCPNNYGGAGWFWGRTQSPFGSYYDVLLAGVQSGNSSTVGPTFGAVTVSRAGLTGNQVRLTFDVAHGDGIRCVQWRVWLVDGTAVDDVYSNLDRTDRFWAFGHDWTYAATEFTGSNYGAITDGKAHVDQIINVPPGRYIELLGTTLHRQKTPLAVLV